jgi:two-component system, NtrC family, sensor kinase
MSERFASLGQRTLDIVHEINNPLAAIAGCSEGVFNGVVKGRYEADLFGNYLRIIQEEVLRCKGITTSTLYGCIWV